MSSLVITMMPDVECIISSDLRDWLTDTIGFHNIFPKDNDVRVSTDHPFVSLLQQQVPDGTAYDLTGFPSVTVVDTNFTKLVETAVTPQVVRLGSDLINEIKEGGRDQFIMSKESLTTLEKLMEGNEFIRAEGYTTVRRTEVAIEVWARNAIEKSKLFDLVSMYLVGHQRYTLHDNHLIIEEGSITGEKSGIYNMDFGEVLYGGMIHFTTSYNAGIYTVKDYDLIKGATVNPNDLLEEE